jgi:hypothetical protein
MAERKADADTYARIFGHGDGAAILEDLKRKYSEKLFWPGGEEGRRRTDFALGANSVVDHIDLMLRQARDGDPNEDDSSAA